MTRIARMRGRLEAFLKTEAASGVTLLAAAVVALALANSQFAMLYRAIWEFPIGVKLHGFAFERSLEWWINDGLMVLFFFVVGLEIRREMHAGELSDWRRAAVPVAAALGGLSLPAGLYLIFAGRPESHAGWGVPMATDIAFAVGVLALLGPRVPPALRVLLLALAIIDDIGAILVIAIFYSSGVNPVGIVLALAGLGLVLMLQRLRVTAKPAYVLPALLTWAGVYAAGIHPTIAGVALGLLTPVEAWSDSSEPAEAGAPPDESPADALIHALHPWVAFAIMPIFAFVNAGVSLAGLSGDAVSHGVVAGVMVGLLLGKPVGVLLATAVVVRLGLGELPAGIGKAHVLVVGIVAGVGFTMALFVAQLAFQDGPLLEAAKLGVLFASGLAGVAAFVAGKTLLSPAQAPPGP
ncbi:MAG TPA: Na+/H+ antiporter NhaA [Polyangiaceae bacterium]|nr:Na+/H+ antiporter NhaA [Polyangiaceae bacterium]